VPPPPKKKKKSGKIFFGQFLWKIRAFLGQKSCKIDNFVNFSGKYHQKNLGIWYVATF